MKIHDYRRRIPVLSELHDQPVFFDVKHSGPDITAIRRIPLLAAVAQSHFSWLGKVAGFPTDTILYQLRRASGSQLDGEQIQGFCQKI